MTLDSITLEINEIIRNISFTVPPRWCLWTSCFRTCAVQRSSLKCLPYLPVFFISRSKRWNLCRSYKRTFKRSNYCKCRHLSLRVKTLDILNPMIHFLAEDNHKVIDIANRYAKTVRECFEEQVRVLETRRCHASTRRQNNMRGKLTQYCFV